MSAQLSHDCNCLALRQAARYVSQFYDRHLATSGLRATQFSILRKLARLGPMTINGLADELVMDRTAMGRNMLPLEREGLVEIAPSETDRRIKELHLTAAGKRRLASAMPLWVSAQKEFEDHLGGAQAGDLRSLLARVVASEFVAPAASRTKRV